MRNFNYSQLSDKKWDTDILSLIAGIYRYAGKQELALKYRSEKLDHLIPITKFRSTESSNAIEGIHASQTRIKQLVKKTSSPENLNEAQIAGYADVFELIGNIYDIIPVNRNFILQLHKMLYKYFDTPWAGKTKSVQNFISSTYPDGHSILFTPLAPYETPDALNAICSEYNRVIGNFEVEPLIVIPIFIHDFLCIHPFNDGNGRMSRLLTTLLLYRSGFQIGKYVSLEAKIANSKDLYYDSLNRSQTGWHEGSEDALPFIKYLLGTILAAYKDFDERFSLVEDKLSAYEMVKRAVESKIGKFKKQDIRDQCPSLSISSIESALRQLVNQGDLRRDGSGRATYYVRLR